MDALGANLECPPAIRSDPEFGAAVGAPGVRATGWSLENSGQGGEWRRLATRAFGFGDERLSYEANDWLMKTMVRECRRPAVTAVHSYEDCSEMQFVEAKGRGKACIYDMPIGYYPFWEKTEVELVERYRDWVPEQGLPSSRARSPEAETA